MVTGISLPSLDGFSGPLPGAAETAKRPVRQNTLTSEINGLITGEVFPENGIIPAKLAANTGFSDFYVHTEVTAIWRNVLICSKKMRLGATRGFKTRNPCHKP